MEYRDLGKSGIKVSALGFGCGSVGGLMVRGAADDQERAVARALDLGVNYFDTAPLYGDGASERNLGKALRNLRADAFVGTKFRLEPDDLNDVAGAVARSLEASLGRLGIDRVTLYQLHNPVGDARGRGALSDQDVLGEVVPALERLREQGKLRFFGITGLGSSSALAAVVDTAKIDTAQVCHNLLNPSAAYPVPADYPAQNFGRLLDRTQVAKVGVLAIRVLAAGALTGVARRHPIAAPVVAPIGSGPDYTTDLQRAGRFQEIVDQGYAGSLAEASIRFAASSLAVSSVLVGVSSLEQLEFAAHAVAKGRLPDEALVRLSAIWQRLAETD